MSNKFVALSKSSRIRFDPQKDTCFLIFLIGFLKF